MKVRMKVGVSGSRNGRPWPAPGEEVNVPDDEGKDLCAAGIAEPVAQRERDRAETREEKTREVTEERRTEAPKAETAERRSETGKQSKS